MHHYENKAERKKNFENKPWLSKRILKSIQQKNLFTKEPLNSMIVIHGRNTNKLTHIKEYSKRLYLKNLVNVISVTPRRFGKL